MSCASAGFALPVNTAIVDWSTRSPYRRALRAAHHLAGVEGFEPSYDGIKTRCLTTWRHPNSQTSRFRGTAPPPGVPAGASGRARGPRNRATPVASPSRAAVRGPAIGERREHAAAGARHLRLAPFGEPGERPAHFGTAPGHHRLAIVASTCLQEAANCRLGGFPCQFRSLKHVGGARSRPPERRRQSAFRAVPGASGAPRPPRPRRLRPCTNSGTSAPSPSPSSARAATGSRKPQISLRATSVVAASELPPPRPPCTGMRFSSRMSTPRVERPAAACSAPRGAQAQVLLGRRPRPARRAGGSRRPRAARSAGSSARSMSWKTVWIS